MIDEISVEHSLILPEGSTLFRRLLLWLSRFLLRRSVRCGEKLGRLFDIRDSREN